MSGSGAKPWYREFWVWFVMAPLIATVIGGFATLIIAGSPPALVVDDFGKIAMAVEADQRRDQRATELGLAGELWMEPGHKAVSVSIRGDAPEALSLHLIHPTRDELDQRVVLERRGETYTGSAARPDTRVYVQITDTDATWRLTGELRPGQRSVELRTAGHR